MLYLITQCYLPSDKGEHPAFTVFYPQPKQVLDLATPEGCKAELTYVKPPRSTAQTSPTLTVCFFYSLHLHPWPSV